MRFLDTNQSIGERSMEGDLSTSYEKIHRANRKYRNKLASVYLFLYGSMILLSVDVLLFPVGLVRNLLPYSVLGAIGFSMIGASLVIASRTEGPSRENRLFMRTYRVLLSLTNYLMDSSKTEYRDAAKKGLRILIERVERLWSLDSVLEEEALSPIKTFKKNLRDKVLYSIEEGSIDNVRGARNVLSHFARFLLEEHPQVARIEEINAPTNLI